MRYFLISLCATILCISCEKNEPYVWQRDVPIDSVFALANNKLILLDFETEWCTWCKKLDEDTYTNQEVKSFAKQHFVSMKIDAEKGEGIDLSKRYSIRGFPTIVFTTQNGDEIDRITGYRGPEEFLREMKRIKSGKNTLPTLLTQFQTNPTHFSTLFKLSKKYESMGDGSSAQRMIGAILAANVDSAGTAAFFNILYKARKDLNPKELIAYANKNPESGYVTTALENAMYFVRRNGKEPLLEADLYYRLITATKNVTPGMINGFAWRMTELDVNLAVALEKITWAIENEPDEKRKHMCIDTKAEVLYKMGNIDAAISEVEKCISFDPEYQHYQDQLEKFKSFKEPA